MIKRRLKKPEIAYMVVRNDTPVAVCEYLEDADDMAARYNQEMKDRGLSDGDRTITFFVQAVPFYD